MHIVIENLIINGALTIHEKSCIRLTPEIKAQIRNDYFNEKRSIKFLKETYNFGTRTLFNILEGKIRSISEAGKIAHKLHKDSFKLSDKTKLKIKEKRIKFMKEHPEQTAWRLKNISYPEKCFLNLIVEKELDKKFLIIREYSVFPYFIDFAFIDIKLAVEIDGSQHKLDDRHKQDIKKDKLLNKNGWKVLRIDASSIMYHKEEVYIKLNDILSNYKNKQSFLKIGIISNTDFKKEQKYINKINKEKSVENKINRVKQLNIDFHKKGWPITVAPILEITPQCVRRWMRRNMLDFYNENCLRPLTGKETGFSSQ